MESNDKLIVVRPLTFPDCTTERMWPRTVASLNLAGSITVAVNLSPARECLLDRVSFRRTFKFVPTGTSGGAAGLGAVFFSPGLVWAAAIIGTAITKRKGNTRFTCNRLSVIGLLLQDPYSLTIWF